MLLSDLQDPPELMGDVIAEWARGTPVVVGFKNTSEENWLMYRIRSFCLKFQHLDSVEFP